MTEKASAMGAPPVPDSVKRAIREAFRSLAAGDVLVVAGKGHEDYQVIEGERRHFSDEEQALDALARRMAS